MIRYLLIDGCDYCPFMDSKKGRYCTRLNDAVVDEDKWTPFDKRCPLHDSDELKDCEDCEDYDETMGICRLTDKMMDVELFIPSWCPKIR